jgi:hypothetical protein
LEDRCVPTTLTPTTFADGGLGSGSLRDAVLQFNADTGTDDDIIQLAAGTYTLSIRNAGGHHETAGLTGDLNVTQTSHRWILQGAGSSGDNATIIDASQLQDRVLQIVTPGTQVVFRDLIIQGGLAQDDGSAGALVGATDALGGGILNNSGQVTLDSVVLRNNVAQGGDAASLGAAGHNARGAGIYSTGGALTIAGAALANNQAIGGRGGDGGYTSSSRMVLGGTGGTAQGGGLYLSGGSLTISTSAITSNQTIAGTGGSYGGSDGAAQGAGLYGGGTLTLTSSSLAGNSIVGASGNGGGIYSSGTLTVTGSTLSGNSAPGTYGTAGAIYASGTLTLSNSTLSGNSASGNGGIYSSGTLTLMGSTLSGNSASGGGGIYSSGTLTVSNSTLSGNSAAVVGGGIYNVIYSGTHSVTLTNVTLTANGAGHNGGGLYSNNFPGTAPVLHNALIAGNFRGATGTTRDDVYGAVDAGGDYNLIGDGTGMSNGVHGNQVGSAAAPIDPLLGPLQDNGGSTQTMALRAGSAALNAGDPEQLGVPDQRGVVRTGGVNIGAYQASATAFLVSAPDTVQSGVPFDVTVAAVDPYGQVAVGYTGTVTFSTSDPDPGVILPADYAFTLGDGGVHTFTDTGLGEITLLTPGDQILTVMDTADNTITGSATLTVSSPAPGPGPHGQGPPPGRLQELQASPTQAEPAPTREPSGEEVSVIERWFGSFHNGDYAWLTVPPLRHQAGATDECLADFFDREGLLASVW